MTMTSTAVPESVSALAAWLRQRHASIREYENRAHSALYDDKNEPAYRELMRERAEQIAALAPDSAALVAALPDALRAPTAASLHQFAEGARNALTLGSVFYMSALLYPDEHQPGEPDNLQRLIARLESPPA